MRTASVRLNSLLFLCGCLGFFVAIGAASGGECTTDSKSGVQVCPVSTSGSNRINYYDTPLYSAKFNKIVYVKKPASGPPEVTVANPDGTDEQNVGIGLDPMMGSDGLKVYFPTRSGPGEQGADLYSYDLGSHKMSRITHVRAARVIQYSPPVHTSKGNLLVYSPGNIAYLIYDDGSENTQLDFDDPYKSDPFHRIRMSPTHPNLIFFNRNHPGENAPLFSYDTETKKTYSVTSRATHMMWAPDGIHIVYNGGPDYHFHMIKYDGTGDRELDPLVREGTAYCTYPPGRDDVVACANFDTSGHYPMPGSLFLLATDGSNRVAYLCLHNAKQEGFWGEPALHYAQDQYHLLFRSDATGDPQVYMAILPADIYNRLKAPEKGSESPQKQPGH